jgi:hypothetical protein
LSSPFCLSFPQGICFSRLPASLELLKTTRCNPHGATPHTSIGIFWNRRGWRQVEPAPPSKAERTMVVLFFIPVLILAIVAVVPAWPYNRNWSYYPSGGLGAILLLTIVLLFMNRL